MGRGGVTGAWCLGAGRKALAVRVHGRRPNRLLCVVKPRGLEVTARARSILRHFLECVAQRFKDRRGYLGEQLHRFVDVIHDPDGPAKLRRIDSCADLLFDPLRHVRPTRIRARGSNRKTATISTASRSRQMVL
jgi:hypothetical protein